MATDEYTCPDDNKTVIIERSIFDAEPEYDCPQCGTTLQRIYTAPPVKFNASGFYSTDNITR